MQGKGSRFSNCSFYNLSIALQINTDGLCGKSSLTMLFDKLKETVLDNMHPD